MGVVCTLLSICTILLVVYVIGRWDARVAHRLLHHSQLFFESEPDVGASVKKQQAAAGIGNNIVKRPYISPLVKKRVAAKQRWRCAVCKQLLDETFEIDHKTPLFRGGHPTDERNLQALCKRDHMFKSAVLDKN